MPSLHEQPDCQCKKLDFGHQTISVGGMPGLGARLERWGERGDLNKTPCGSTVHSISLKVCNQRGFEWEAWMWGLS